VAETALGCEREELVVRNAAPHEEREPRRELEIRDAVDLADRDVLGLALEAVQEARARQEPRQRVLDADLEAAALVPAEPVERHQLVELVGRRGMAVRARREARQDFLRADRLLARGIRVADEDLAPARRVAGTFGGEPTRDPQR